MKIIVIGMCNIDYLVKLISKTKLSDSNPANIVTSFGGVGKNIAHNLVNLDNNVSFLTAISKDNNGKLVKEHLESIGLDISHALYSDKPSSMYISTNDVDGDLLFGAHDMKLVDDLSIEFITKEIDYINSFDYVVMDTNLNTEILSYLINKINKPIFIDCVSTYKAKRITVFNNIYCLKGNVHEIKEITNIDDYKLAAKELVNRGVKKVVISLGKDGVYYYDGNNELTYPTLVTNIVNTNGAGDAMFASIIDGFANNMSIEDTLKRSLLVAKYTIECEASVNEKLKELL